MDNYQPKSIISKQLASFLKQKCYVNEETVNINLIIPKVDGFFKIKWKCIVSEESKDETIWFDIILGHDFLSGKKESPIHSFIFNEEVLALCFKNGIIHQFPIQENLYKH